MVMLTAMRGAGKAGINMGNMEGGGGPVDHSSAIQDAATARVCTIAIPIASIGWSSAAASWPRFSTGASA